MNKKALRIGIVGAGLIGKKRAEVIANTKRGTLVAIADPDHARATALAKEFNVHAMGDWKELVARKDIDIVIVAVPNAFEAAIVIVALKHGKHVLCEKPFGISVKESKAMIAAAKKAKRIVKVGFNHRFHRAFIKAHEIWKKGGIGKRILFIRARYGHGGRKGMEKEWRFNKKISGGGELLDQGVHIIDLARWFAGDMKSVYGLARTKFWKTKLDDNTFAFLENDRTTVSFHVSTTNWKNIFSFEIFGDEGYLEISGKNGSYGRETLMWGKKNVGAAPDIETFLFKPEDESWQLEWKHFMEVLGGRGTLSGNANDGLEANKIVEALYRSSREKRAVKLT